MRITPGITLTSWETGHRKAENTGTESTSAQGMRECEEVLNTDQNVHLTGISNPGDIQGVTRPVLTFLTVLRGISTVESRVQQGEVYLTQAHIQEGGRPEGHSPLFNNFNNGNREGSR